MFRILMTAVFIAASSVAVYAGENQTAPTAMAAPPGLVLVPVNPCRLIDTRMSPARTPAEESSRTIDLDVSHCGRVMPALAVSYAILTTNYDTTPPEKLPPGATPFRRASIVAAPPNRQLVFPVPPNQDLAVDVTGFYVPPGTAVSPAGTNVGGASTPPSTSVVAQGAIPKLTPSPTDAYGDLHGTDGDVILTHPTDTYSQRLSTTGVMLVPHIAYPWSIARGGDNGFAAGFAIWNVSLPSADAEIASFHSDGVINLGPLSSLSGRTSYSGPPAILTNVVHNVNIPQPRDNAGGATSRVTFFNAESGEDSSGPDLTKYHAAGPGQLGRQNYNFDSSFKYHTGEQYHFRAYSAAENKETFWVRGEGTTSVTGTRADMFVSGSVGIGATPGSVPGAPSGKHALEVFGAPFVNGAAREIAAVYDNATPYNQTPSAGIVFGGKYNSTGNIGVEFASIQGIKANTTDGDYAGALVFLTRTNLGQPTEQMRINPSGDITIAGNINAKYQDVAEWVPASEPMSVGTVVVLNPQRSNEVMPSSAPYDTSVAGVVSDRPGLLLGEGADSKAKIATTGRVRVRVDASRGAIHIGDLLVSSDKPGVAMRSEPVDVAGVKMHRPGTLIGKALEPLERGEGEILVLLSLQ
jgi:hypothetical protein